MDKELAWTSCASGKWLFTTACKIVVFKEVNPRLTCIIIQAQIKIHLGKNKFWKNLM
jgi:hypothetical protein